MNSTSEQACTSAPTVAGSGVDAAGGDAGFSGFGGAALGEHRFPMLSSWYEQHAEAGGCVREWFGTQKDMVAIAALVDAYRAPTWATGFISPFDAMFLMELVRATRPRVAVEVGTASGVSSAVLAAAMWAARRDGAEDVVADGEGVGDDGVWVHSFDVTDRFYGDPTKRVGSAVSDMVPALADRVRVHVGGVGGGGAAQLGEKLGGAGLTMAFIDADHRHPWAALDVLLVSPALARGAWIALHDVNLPAIFEEQNQRTGSKHDPAVHGPMWVLERWPFETLRGEGKASNMGAVRLPVDRDLTTEDLVEILELPWETQPWSQTLKLLGLKGRD